MKYLARHGKCYGTSKMNRLMKLVKFSQFRWAPCYIYTETHVYMYLPIHTWLCVCMYRCVCVTKTVLQNHLFVFKSFHFILSTERKTQHSIIFGVIFFFHSVWQTIGIISLKLFFLLRFNIKYFKQFAFFVVEGSMFDSRIQ